MTLNILCIEDEIVNAHFLQRSLNKLLSVPFEIHIAHDGAEGVAMAKRLIPDLIIMDFNMPGMDGLTATECLKADLQTQDIPIIMLTAGVESEIAPRARALGVASFLSKPISLRLLRHTVETVLRLNEDTSVAS